MQSQQTITKSPVHVKVAHDNEWRRFLLNPITFDNLQTTLKTLFALETEFRIKFQDDEKDWVLLTTDQELVYATELSDTLLRLSVQVKLPETPKPADTCIPSVGFHHGGKFRGCRGGRGRGAGRCGGLKSPEERLTMKSSRLTELINQLEAKINSNQFPSDRERVLRWRLTKLQEKLVFVQAMKESLANAPQTPETTTASDASPVSDATPGEEQRPFCKGGRCGRGRGGWRRAMMEDGTDHPVRERKCERKGERKCHGLHSRLAPEVIANFRQCKSTLRAAREGGNPEEIQAAMEAFQAAKAAKFEALTALRAQDAPKASTDEQTA